MYIEKVGQNKFGFWVIFEYSSEDLVIKGIANTKLEHLQSETRYENLCLQIISKNSKTYFNIIEK